MGVISWIILGLIAGFVASKILNRTGSGLVLHLVLWEGRCGRWRPHLLRSIWDERGHRRQPLEHRRLGDWRDCRAVDLRGAGREILTHSAIILSGPAAVSFNIGAKRTQSEASVGYLGSRAFPGCAS